ncbi:MAG TPA: hypothetical protein VJS15_01680 [Allosphingosinicella sp.]|nr:hypothetical protein [Allosphingosinicella sp.]
MATAGSAYFSLKSGKEVGPFTASYEKDDNYLDVTKGGKDYPTKLDFNKFKTVVGISFKPGVGKKLSWSSWSYFNNAQWAADRFTNLG